MDTQLYTYQFKIICMQYIFIDQQQWPFCWKDKYADWLKVIDYVKRNQNLRHSTEETLTVLLGRDYNDDGTDVKRLTVPEKKMKGASGQEWGSW